MFQRFGFLDVGVKPQLHTIIIEADGLPVMEVRHFVAGVRGVGMVRLTVCGCCGTAICSEASSVEDEIAVEITLTPGWYKQCLRQTRPLNRTGR